MKIGQAWNSLKNVLRSTFGKHVYREAKEASFHTTKEKPAAPQEHYERRSWFYEVLVPWCEAFNRRNGNRVPPKSPESIYFAAHRHARATAKLPKISPAPLNELPKPGGNSHQRRKFYRRWGRIGKALTAKGGA